MSHLGYLCPHCRSHLRVGNSIVFSARRKKMTGGLLFLHPELGNYSVEKNESFRIQEGEKVNIHCPVCGHDLASSRHRDLAMIVLRDEEGAEYEVYFSRIAGEKSTFKLLGEHMEIFGEHAEQYLDFFNLSEMA